jgi:uncharacterized protein
MNNNYWSNGSIVENANQRIQTYMNHVYGWMSVGLLLTGLVAWFASTNVAVLQMLYKGMWVLAIAQIGIVFVLSGMVKKLSGSAATALFMVYSVLTGLTCSIYLLVFTGESIASTFFVTTGMFAALSVYGYSTKRNLSGLGSFLFMGLIGIVLASLINIFLKSEPLMWAITYIGVFVFALLTAYDTQKLKQFGETVSTDDADSFRRYAIIGALTLYLDFINLFIMLLRILGDRR